uniref:hypothetical protein n=1 Tax=Aestuariivirga sp. TaxID=2650926 RepID=UPI003593190F
LTKPDEARSLLVAALAGAKHPPRIILLARRDDVGPMLRLPGVYCVVTFPLLPAQIRAAVTDRRSKRRNSDAPKEPPAAAEAHAAEHPEQDAHLKSPEAAAKHASWPGFRLYFLTAGRFMTVVSNLYKNAAFVLLATLFAAFSFYGFLIGYFLLASSWGAPMTLTRGHQMVEKAVNDVGEMQVALAQNSQRMSEAQLEASKAKAAYDDATVLVDFMNGTITSEIAARLQQSDIAGKQAARIEKVISDFRKEEANGGKGTNPRTLFDKRLITKKSYDAKRVGSLEAAQRLSALEGELDQVNGEISRLETSLTLLSSLKEQLEGGKIGKVSSGSAELILLTKEAVDARSILDQASSQLTSATERQNLLKESATQIKQRISDIENGALGRAVKGRIDVIFVPYGNERSFAEGAPLYSCALTVLFCHRAGTVGQALPGESTAVHPFFGKPLRGYFVEATLDDPAAASEEIIHAGRAPFFF